MRASFIFLAFYYCFLSAVAQTYFRQSGIQLLTQDEGLNNNTVHEICQDKEGFIWLGTDIGLSRYDGIHFHNYSFEASEPHGIERICEMESESLLWLKLAATRVLPALTKYKENTWHWQVRKPDC